MRKRESKRMLLDEEYSLDTPSPEMVMLAMEDFFSREVYRSQKFPNNVTILGVEPVGFHLAKH